MIILNNNSTNIISLTLSECQYDVVTGSTSGYTMTLINDTTKEEFTNITLTDLSSYPERYNQFTLELTTLPNIDYSNSKIYLKDSGMYTYYIYYNTTTSTLIEEGFCKVNTSDLISEYQYDITDDYFSYEN